ncbi:hypothetical protein [Streptomyces qinglanensis]|uniref:hypothetical protein n=1 Tax=Streptomyces qinglanensis TaxID=943816 RepID=UPI003D743C49
MPQTFYQNGLRVPYIAPWTHEIPRVGPLKRHRGRGGEGLGYADENPAADRNSDALWMRVPIAPGRGQARLGSIIRCANGAA